MRIPKDDRSGEGPKLKGFGYVEFEDRESLMSALIIPDTVSSFCAKVLPRCIKYLFTFSEPEKS